MNGLNILLFGPVRLFQDGSKEIALPPQVQALLAYLLLNRHRTIAENDLANLLFSDEDPYMALSILATALRQLKVLLEPEGVRPGTYIFNSCEGEVGFNLASRYTLDVDLFERKIVQTLAIPIQTAKPEQLDLLIDALDLYQDELMSGFFDEWVLRERERLGWQYLDGLTYLMRYHHYHGAFRQAIYYARRILAIDPLRADIQAEMIHYHLELGQRAAAVKSQDAYRRRLKKELGYYEKSGAKAPKTYIEYN